MECVGCQDHSGGRAAVVEPNGWDGNALTGELPIRFALSSELVGDILRKYVGGGLGCLDTDLVGDTTPGLGWFGDVLTGAADRTKFAWTIN